VRNPQFILNLAAKLVIVLFAGGGGSCTGIEQAIARHVDIAANHSDNAIACHTANHPQCRHYREDVRRLCPRELTGGRPAGYLHLSPDCTHFSQAKGGQPRDAETRSLSWVGIRWAGTVRPDVITLENVKEILKWGRLIAKRDKETGRVVKIDGTVAAPGEVVPLRQQFLVPDPKHAGKTWMRFVAILRGLGYVVEWKVLCAADYGVPTTRTRLFMIARGDGKPIVWPEPTHFKNPKPGQKKWVAAHTCIDWSIPSRSIFNRQRWNKKSQSWVDAPPLAEATLRRVARGLKKFVLDSADPFIVPVTHSGSERVHSIHDPLRTVTTARRGEFMLCTPYLAKFRGESPGSAITDPVPTITSGAGSARPAGAAHALAAVTAFVAQANGGFNETPGHDARQPFSTITAKGSNQQLVSAHLAHLRNHCDARDLREPLRTISAGGEHHALIEYHLSPEAEEGALRCAAFLLEYYSEGGQWSDLRQPMNTITTRDRLALVTVWIKGDPYVVVDICLRMLVPRELANAMSVPPQYILTHGADGRVFTKSQQVNLIGNMVPPLLQQAVTAANYSDLDQPIQQRKAA
jgi:DNA (cytosine-5)-methyltransferase 1